jgi:long-chain acyl-CoA synthetase
MDGITGPNMVGHRGVERNHFAHESTLGRGWRYPDKVRVAGGMSDCMPTNTGGHPLDGYPRTASERRSHLAVACETESLTYGELDDRSSRLAAVLTDLGVRAGDRLGIMLPNSIEFIECLAASAKLEVSSLTINWHLKADELAWILADSDPSVLVAHVDLADVVDAANGGHRPVLWVGGDYEDRVAASASEPIPYAWPTSWPVIYTSGTSGRPKGVVHGATAVPEIMVGAYTGLSALWGYTEDDVHLVAGPLYHAGPSGYCNLTLYVGGTVIIMDDWDPREFLRIVATHRVTTTFLTPAHFIRLLEVPAEEWARYDTSSLRHVIHAGAPCPQSVKARIIEALPRAEIWELYGASEGGATRVSSDDWLERPGTVGRAWPGVEIRIIDPDSGQGLGIEQDGLIYVRPAQGRFHYHNDDEKTASAWRDGAFTVGDVGHLDADGYLYLTDRQADMVIRSGVNVYPREIEEVLHRHDAVVDCAVFGIPHERDGEQLKAVVETRRAVPVAELDEWCHIHLDAFKCPSVIDLTDTLPRDPNGKVLKRLLRDEAWSSAGRQI